MDVNGDEDDGIFVVAVEVATLVVTNVDGCCGATDATAVAVTDVDIGIIVNFSSLRFGTRECLNDAGGKWVTSWLLFVAEYSFGLWFFVILITANGIWLEFSIRVDAVVVDCGGDGGGGDDCVYISKTMFRLSAIAALTAVALFNLLLLLLFMLPLRSQVSVDKLLLNRFKFRLVGVAILAVT